MRRVKVIYDISKLGEGYPRPPARTGLFRVVENVAAGLVASPECEVSFSATESFRSAVGCLAYLESHPKFKGVPFLAPRLARLGRTVDDRLTAANDAVDGERAAAGGFKLHRRVERRLLARAYGAVEGSRLIVPRRLARADVFHSPHHPVPKTVRGVSRFLTFYDIIPILYPQFCTPTQTRQAEETVGSIEPGDWVICISQATKDDLCGRSPVDPARVFVAHLAAAPELFHPCDDDERIARARSKYGIPEGRYLLSLSTLEPRKNIEQVVRSFARLVQQERLADLNLVLVGGKGWLFEKIFETLSGYDALKERIVVTGFVEDEDLAPIYGGALAFVFPTFYEGFGLPALEAMQCGAPVITSNTSSLPEVVGDAAVMLDPADSDGLCEAVLRVYGDAALRASMSRKSLERARLFSWEKCVAETVTAYRTALAGGRG